MTMTPAKKKFLGLLSFWSIFYIIAFNIAIFSMFGFMEHTHGLPEWFFGAFAVIFVIHMATILSMIGQMIFYIWHVITQNPHINDQQNMKIIWVLMFFMVGIFAFPVYWYKYIWHEPLSEIDEFDVAQSLS